MHYFLENAIFISCAIGKIGGSYDTVKRILKLPKNKKLDETDIYNKWNSPKSNLLQKISSEKKLIPMPPPNITGKLHMGHALFLSIQDSLHRYYKITGRDSIWYPGLDHAGLATYDKILHYMNEHNLNYDEASQTIESNHKSIILKQMKKTGAFPDWNYQLYTLEYDDFIFNILDLLKRQGRIYEKEGQTYLNLKYYAKELLANLDNFRIIPQKEIKNLKPFLENFHDWNISRDIPWGTKLNEHQTLDTWFNSSLWIIAFLHKHPELKDFYPANILETGSDILFFWCAKMLMMSSWAYDNQQALGLELKSRYCFDTIYLHGIIRDSKGIKMSKSLGNGIDPLDIINRYGADAMRLFLLTRSGPAEDIIWNDTDLKSMNHFINKIYQAGRLLSIASYKQNFCKLDRSSRQEHDFNKDKEKYISYMENYQLLEASRYIYRTFKTSFCNTWLEENKDDLFQDRETLKEALIIYKDFLLMLYPFCPFITSKLLEDFYD